MLPLLVQTAGNTHNYSIGSIVTWIYHYSLFRKTIVLDVLHSLLARSGKKTGKQKAPARALQQTVQQCIVLLRHWFNLLPGFHYCTHHTDGVL